MDVLDFLQYGFDLGLSLNTLKVPISALSSFTSKRWTLEPLVKKFLRGVLRLRPPRRNIYPQWDLSLVLSLLNHLYPSLQGGSRSFNFQGLWFKRFEVFNVALITFFCSSPPVYCF